MQVFLRTLTVGTIALCLILAGTFAWAQQGGNPGGKGGKGGNGGQHLQPLEKIGNMLDRVHGNPNARAEVLQHMRQKLQERKVQDIDARLGAISQILDSVTQMNDATYQQQRPQLAQQVFKQMHGGGKSQKNNGGGS
jgi:hypothetical protein